MNRQTRLGWAIVSGIACGVAGSINCIAAEDAGDGKMLYEVVMRQAVVSNPFGVNNSIKAKVEDKKSELSGKSNKALSDKPSAEASQAASKKAKPAERPRLAGIIGSGDSHMAIIEYAGRSSMYEAGDSVGSYQLRSVGAEKIELVDGENKLYLQIGQ